MKHALASEHRAGRLGLIELGRGLSDDDGDRRTTACPDWSIKDVFAHLAGISTDILAGNTEDAATVAWADAHVADRTDRSLTEVLDEWETAAATVDELIAGAGELFRFELFLDQWTHEWDIRASVGAEASCTPDLAVCRFVLDKMIDHQQGQAPVDSGTLEIAVEDRRFQLGSGPALGTLQIGLFDYTRASMGRRSATQLDALPWPSSITDRAVWIDTLVAWSVNEFDVDDPVTVPDS